MESCNSFIGRYFLPIGAQGLESEVGVGDFGIRGGLRGVENRFENLAIKK
jgi:hypothetical protein